jgi:hypothetical protein
MSGTTTNYDSDQSVSVSALLFQTTTAIVAPDGSTPTGELPTVSLAVGLTLLGDVDILAENGGVADVTNVTGVAGALNITADGGTVNLEPAGIGALSGTQILIENGGTVSANGTFLGALDASSITFGAGDGTLYFNSDGTLINLDVTAPITGFSGGDLISDQNVLLSAVGSYSITNPLLSSNQVVTFYSGANGGGSVIGALTFAPNTFLGFAAGTNYSTGEGPLQLVAGPGGDLTLGSGSLTVIGGHSLAQPLSGIVNIDSGFTGSLVTNLQSQLTAASGAVSTNAANFENLNVAGSTGAQTVTVGAFSTGVLDISNYDSVSATTPGAANVSVTVPGGYNTLVVQAPGSETVTGNGGSGLLAVFDANSSVNFDFAGGSGTVYAPGHDSATLSGAADYFVGGAAGNDTVIASGASAAVTLAGAGNLVQAAAQNTSIASNGSSDILITSNTSGSANINVTGNATIDNAGSADTVTATGTGAFIGYFQGSAGGRLDFINSGTGASSVIASLNPSSGAISSQGSVTVSAGGGGGVYDGGISGNNSLVGGSGAVTLFSAGINNYLFADGAPGGSNYNLLNAYSGGNDTLIAGSNSTNNVFFGGVGTESIQSSGSGVQDYFVGTLGSETISGSTVSGASNAFIFQQSASQGGGTDVLQNFQPGGGFINVNNGVTGVDILSFESLSGAHPGTQIDLSNGTTIKLFGVASSAFNASIVGGTHF